MEIDGVDYFLHMGWFGGLAVSSAPAVQERRPG